MRIRTTPLFEDMVAIGSSRLRGQLKQDARIPLDRFSGMLETKFDVQLQRLEKHQPHVVPPWWTPPFICISESADEVIKEHDATSTDTVRI